MEPICQPRSTHLRSSPEGLSPTTNGHWGRELHGVTDVSAGVRYPRAAGANHQRLMKGGFLLNYAAGDCAACEESGRRCRINTDYDISECHCANVV